eukprot:TRINITY_DN11343_c0_g1_i1.p1 TRINITY_DN11343_c0_g1~~TRINITY_DN11343_c0_g1_i1.p1  ORF type:complete len:113 (-),score=16.72 TRINITY_DN11343_c0_g1_i1:122-460(-)
MSDTSDTFMTDGVADDFLDQALETFSAYTTQTPPFNVSAAAFNARAVGAHVCELGKMSRHMETQQPVTPLRYCDVRHDATVATAANKATAEAIEHGSDPWQQEQQQKKYRGF